ASFEKFPWARAAGLVFRGERDAIFTAFRNDERARFCHFPDEPLARDKWVFFVRAADAGKLKFSSFDDLVGHDIAVLRGASISPEFWDFVHQHRNFAETASDEANFRMLEAGRVDYKQGAQPSGAQLMAVQGPLTRSVRDARLALAVMSDGDPCDTRWADVPLEGPPLPRPIRVALVPQNPGGFTHPAQAEAVRQAGRHLATAGYAVEE